MPRAPGDRHGRAQAAVGKAEPRTPGRTLEYTPRPPKGGPRETRGRRGGLLISDLFFRVFGHTAYRLETLDRYGADPENEAPHR